jgi:hypothetical protein
MITDSMIEMVIAVRFAAVPLVVALIGATAPPIDAPTDRHAGGQPPCSRSRPSISPPGL